MGVHIEGNKLVIIIEPKTFYFDLPKNIDNLKHEIDFVIKQWIFSWVYKKNSRLSNYCPNIGMIAIFTNAEKSKTNDPHKFVL